jgi:hypothetical protein
MSREKVTLSWDSTRNGALATITTSSKGGGVASIKVPNATGGTHIVIAKGAKSGAQVKVKVTVKPSVSISPKSGSPGTRVTVTIRGFKAGESIDVRWYVTSSETTVVKRQLIAKKDGSATTTFTVPSSAKSGSHRVEAVGRDGSKASYTFKVTSVRSTSVDEPEEESRSRPERTAVSEERARPTATPPPDAEPEGSPEPV